MTCGTACGKVILLGEHAVVHGTAALAVGIDRGASAVAEDASEPILCVRSWNMTVGAGEDPPLARAFRDLLATCGRRGGVRVEAEANLPPGGGLGCSAALGVAVARALDPAAPAEAVAERVMAWERVFHGNPSGVDAAVSALGGCVLFQRKDGGHAAIERVPLRRAFHLAVGTTGIASSTKAMVDAVAHLRERRPADVAEIFASIGALVTAAVPAIEAGEARTVGRLLDDNQRLLRELAVSTTELERLCETARAAGALGAKLTGAGGGGCAVALVEDPASGAEVVDAWRRGGFDGFVTTFGAEPASGSRAAVVEGSP